MNRTVVLFLGLMLQGLVGWAQQGNQTMTKVITRDVSPGVKIDAFEAKPKTLYRIAEKYARLEEAADTKNGIQGLIIIVEPDIWQINLLEKTGRHIVDSGPTFNFHAPIIYNEDTPKSVVALEFGEEYQFMKAHNAAKSTGVVVDGQKCDRYDTKVEGYEVALFTKAATEIPIKVEVRHKGDVMLAVVYDAYETGLSPNLDLFKIPAGIVIEEAK